MGMTYGGVRLARASSAANPFTSSTNVLATEKVLVVLLKIVGGTNRAGGALTWGDGTLTQANSTQKAVTSPEASAELWYLLNPLPGTRTLTIPNTGALTMYPTVVTGIPAGGGRCALVGANGGNATSTNPTPGAVTVTEVNSIGFAITAGGWTSWAPSAQAGTSIANTDDGAHGGGEQYLITSLGSSTLSWTFATSDDWGAVAAFFSEIAPLNLENYKAVSAVSAGVISVGDKLR